MDQRISKIMANFNFYRVHEVMNALNWTWHDDSEPPSLKRLKEAANNSLKRVAEEKIKSTQSGGFLATKYKDEHGDEQLELMFVVEDWNSGE